MTDIHACPNPECVAPCVYEDGKVRCSVQCGYVGPTGWDKKSKKPKHYSPAAGGYWIYSPDEAIRLHNALCSSSESPAEIESAIEICQELNVDDDEFNINRVAAIMRKHATDLYKNMFEWFVCQPRHKIYCQISDEQHCQCGLNEIHTAVLAACPKSKEKET